ncbi:hypothetical protein JTB14_016115 [Gonioctena quinquepunctata]|nr:hypothetical protein JTB14_016115 [Gonioctena quinquepunctata]
MNDDELILRRKRQNADRARAYRKRKKDLGIGYQTALALASRGCRVIIACRNNIAECQEEIIRKTRNPNVVVKHLDLTSFDSVRKFAKEINANEPELHILINNAGILTNDLEKTSDGLQITMQVNYFGHFLLTLLLIDLLEKSSPSRIIFTSSLMAFMKKLESSDLSASYNNFISPGPYADSKTCDIIAAKCFAEKLGKGNDVTAYSLHPGVVRTGIFMKALKNDLFKNPVAIIIGMLSLLFGKNAEEGAQTIIFLATDEEVPRNNGRFFIESYPFLFPSQVNDEKFREDVWKSSIKCAKLESNEISI